ncbi:MAG: histidine kinase, partial [Bacteroidota bacterium]
IEGEKSQLNNISFEYIGICLTNPEKVRYKFMLEGFEKTWSPASKETFARYSNLSAGKYSFKVMSCNNEGLWNKEPTTFSFMITPPVWKTWWFRITLALSAIILIVIFFRVRTEAIRRKEAEKLSREIQLATNELKALRAQMDPHFIFNSLNSIQSFIMSKDEESALRYLSKFSKLMRMILSNSEKTFVTIREEIDSLNLYLELESLRWDNKFDFTITIDPKVETDFCKIPGMLIQPYVENAIIHGVTPKTEEKGKIEIRISQTDTHIICMIEDNGIGRKKSQQLKTKTNQSLYESMGMKITSERLEALNRLHHSELSVRITDMEDAYGNGLGTKVELFIPIK